ncbi:hypothetical protein C8F04DRAFT_1267984 [Mycena alexandri]|uniref:Uncharacterized protein n=1 Tax=Mycena alexandri TaxID=1745969 RepID=A0AAD6SF42_9AGAR|nr:hypothetical protein C8F04DRAFT_1267984 [Mycena alexandri]
MNPVVLGACPDTHLEQLGPYWPWSSSTTGSAPGALPPLAPAVPRPNSPQNHFHHLEMLCTCVHLRSPSSYWPCACATAGLAPSALPRLCPPFRPSDHPSDDTLSFGDLALIRTSSS